MPRRKRAEDGHEIIDRATYNKLTKDFRRRGGVIVRGEKAARHLNGIAASAAYIPGIKTAVIRDDATISDMMEEIYHADEEHAAGRRR